MRRTKQLAIILMIFILLIVAILPNSLAVDDDNDRKIISSGQYEKGYRYNIQGWVYIHIEGEPYERGYQYGYLASAEIVDMIKRWSKFGGDRVKIMNLYYINDAERYWELCKSITMRIAWEEYPEEYRQEIKGIADGIKSRGETVYGRNVNFEDIVTLSEMQGCWYRLRYFWKQFHPMRSMFYGVKNIFSGKTTSDEEGFCSTFIATGNATADGGIVAVHSTQPIYELDERFNFVVDVNPSQGNRCIMAGTPPGFIWGLTQYYINEKGIVIMESTLPQGPWSRRGTPIAVRARNAIQYSDCIDDVIDNFINGNNGLYECEWLIGDSKTGEIASIELALYNTPIKRTFNGFYWSCNAPHDSKVKKELSGGIPPVISNLIKNVLERNANVFENKASPRAEKFQEIEEEYYGQIDIEIAKKIISTSPLCKNSCDTKITTTKLMENMGLVTHMGNPDGSQWNPTDEQKKNYEWVTPLPVSGWVEIYGLNSNPEFLQSTDVIDYKERNSKILWQYEAGEVNNRNYSSSVVSEGVVYAATSSGEIYALDAKRGKQIWTVDISGESVEPVLSGKILFVGNKMGVYAINKEGGKIEWKKTIGMVTSKPIVTADLVIVSSSDNNIYALDKDSGIEDV